MDRTYAAYLARSLMNKHDLGHWVFEFDRAKRRAGCCKHRSQTITLSSYHVLNNSEEEIKDTILHEIAHALAGPNHGHDQVWKAICITIGAKPARCCGNTVTMPDGRWQAQCNSCQKRFHKYRKPKELDGRYCAKCGPVDGSLLYKLVG